MRRLRERVTVNRAAALGKRWRPIGYAALTFLSTPAALAHAQLYKHHDADTGVTTYTNFALPDPARPVQPKARATPVEPPPVEKKERAEPPAVIKAAAEPKPRAGTQPEAAPLADAKPKPPPVAEVKAAEPAPPETRPAPEPRPARVAAVQVSMPKLPEATGRVSNKEFPRVPPALQKSRDSERLRILQDELASEQLLLEQAIAGKAASEVVQRYQANVDALRREIAQVQ